MIRARGSHKDGRPLMILGLSHENLARLVADEPIMFDAEELGFDGVVVIVAGKTEDEIAASLAPLTGGPV